MRPRYCLVGLMVLLNLVFSGCRDHDQATDLIASGQAASKLLESYYSHLNTATLEWWQYQMAFNTIQEIEMAPELEALTRDRIDAFQIRTALARRLADVYDSLGQLESSASTQPAVAAAQNLGKSMSGIPKLPGVDLSEGFGKAAGLLVNLQLSRDFKKANQAMTEAIARIRDQFLREQDIYRSIVRDCANTRHALIQSLARKGLVDATPMIERLKLEVIWKTGDDKMLRTLALNLDSIHAQRLDSSWACATEETVAVLNILVTAHELPEKQAGQIHLTLDRTQRSAAACLAAANGEYK
jgi:hypothetical protein